MWELYIGELSGEQLSQVAIALGAIVQGAIFWGQFSQVGIVRGVIVWRQLSGEGEAIIQWGSCPWRNCPAPKIFTLRTDKSDAKKNIGKYFRNSLLQLSGLIYTSSASFNEFKAKNTILFQFNFFGEKLKTLRQQGYFTTVTACPSFT